MTRLAQSVLLFLAAGLCEIGGASSPAPCRIARAWSVAYPDSSRDGSPPAPP
jgi:hypothetical protein